MLRIWTKKLGQKHYTRDGMDVTLCGMPMLGNNYADTIPENEQKECEACLKVLEMEQKQKGNKDTSANSYKELISNLRKRLELTITELRKLEEKGTEEAANDSLWIAYGIWNGPEYAEIETTLRKKGHKSSIDLAIDKNKRS